MNEYMKNACGYLGHAFGTDCVCRCCGFIGERKRFRIVWAREFLDPEFIKGYYIVEKSVLDNYKQGDVSPMIGLQLFPYEM